jgi:hypothetical protein
MSEAVSLELPKRSSARILTSPRVTVRPRNRLPHRARNGHAHGSGGGERFYTDHHRATRRRCRSVSLGFSVR